MKKHFLFLFLGLFFGNPFQSILLAAPTKAPPEEYLLCLNYVVDHTPKQTRLRNAFWKATEPPAEEEREDPQIINLWHNRLLTKAGALLESLEIDYKKTTLDKGMAAIRVSGVPNGGELNQFVYKMEQWLGVEFYYAPSRLLKKDGRFSRAKYNKAKSIIFLSHEFVDGVKEDESLHHEVLHAVFNWLRASRIDGLFHGEIKSVDDKEPLWETDHYEQRMSFEELATYPLNLRLFGKGLEHLYSTDRLNTADAEKLLAEIKRKTTIINQVSAETADLLNRFLAAFKEEETSLKLEIKALPKSKLGHIEVGHATLTWETYQIKIPLVSDEDTAIVYEFLASDGEAKKTLGRAVNKKLRDRLTLVAAMAQNIENQTDEILNRTSSFAKKCKKKGLKSGELQDYLSLLHAPREMTFPYINSLNGEPKETGQASKIPRPEEAP